MKPKKISSESLRSELTFSTSRSSGPGGQNVNKTNTRVTLRWNIANSALVEESDKAMLLEKLSSLITRDGDLVLHVQENRSQLQNKELALQKLDLLLTKAFTRRKSRKRTKPSFSSVQQRIKEKKIRGEKKKLRNRPD